VKLYAVIPTHNRHDDLADLLDSIPPDVHVVVIDNASEPDVQFALPLRFLGRRIQVLRDEEQPPNLSRLWNLGLDWSERLHRLDDGTLPDEQPLEEYAVAILNDDVVLPPVFLKLMAEELVKHNVDIAFPGGIGDRCWVNEHQPFPGVGLRMTGWCFVVRGSSGLRADESLRWWCGDDDLQAQAVMNSRGTVRVGMFGHQAEGLRHKYPDESTIGVLREQTDADMATFVAKWGRRPW